jgi:hypothetical protein
MNTGPIGQTIEQAFSAIIAALSRFVGSRREARTKWGDPIAPLPTPLIVAVYARLININRRFQALMVQIRNGTLRGPRARRPEEAARRKVLRAERAAMDPPPPRKPPHRELPLAYGPMAPLPRDFGYVLRLVPWHAAPLANEMRILLEKPEMAEIIAATPRLQRVLRPLCHMLGIKTPVIETPVIETGVIETPVIETGVIETGVIEAGGLIPPPLPAAAVGEASGPAEGPANPPGRSAGETRAGAAASRGGGLPIRGAAKTASG